MRLIWICNKVPQPLAKLFALETTPVGGWLDFFCQRIIDTPDIEFSIVYPGTKKSHAEKSGISYYCFEEHDDQAFKSVFYHEAPDIIHVWGTEFIHSYHAIRAAKELNMIRRCIVSIQGLVSIYGKYHYTEGIPGNVVRRLMPRDILKPSSIIYGRNDYLKKGKYEIKTLQMVDHVIGRTDWDRAISYLINPKLSYYFCNECLRDSFYVNQWDLNNIERHSIFVSQSNYPIKGFHYMLDALRQIIEYYPDTVLYTTGKDLLHLAAIDIAKLTSYQKFIIHLIKKYGLENHVKFLGMLSEEEMCSRYCRSHVFVSPSTIENSPNSLGEAMILGCPVVSTDVGGVKNMMRHEEEGYIYQSSAPYMCAYYVMQIFQNDNLALKFSLAERNHAQQIFDRSKNYSELMKIYQSVNGHSGKEERV